MSVREKVVIVTGGAMGIGRWIAKSFAAEGAHLAIADIASTDTVVKEIEAMESRVLPVKTDVSVEGDVRSLMERVHAEYGRIDVLINNAALVTHFQSGLTRWPFIRDMDEEFFEKVMRTNLFGTFLCTKHALPYMEQQGSGHVISIGQGSIGSDASTGSLGSCVYGTSKIAIRAFTQRVAPEEREFNICIVSMGPGGSGLGRGIATEITPDDRRNTMAPVESVGDRYVLAAEAPLEFTGQQLTVQDGKLAIAAD